jgi:selenocysteine-specific elongation factor
MHVLATAGHVDHGKSTLVRSLTGMEPDRWAEERRRGLTIDLGYAWTTLPTGEQLAFVDVPGHERFIGNMLAGLGPAPGVLFVVAADEGWARQSDDHLAAIDALDLRRGLLAVTRSDLAEPTATIGESLDRIKRSSLGDIEAIPVSGVTGAGLNELRSALSRLVTRLPPPDQAAPVRLWVDRAFTVRGSGTVVTGTLAAGSIGLGDTLLLRDRKVVVRGAQSLGAASERVGAVARIAVNLRGVAADEVGRGDVLSAPGRWHRTEQIDVRLDGDRIDVRAGLVLHIGTAALPVHIRSLGHDSVRLTLPSALPLRAGDRGVLRDPSRHSIAGGVLVLDADPPALRRRGAAQRRADELATATGRPDLEVEVGRRGAVRVAHLVELGVTVDDTTTVAGWLVSDEQRHNWTARAPELVRGWAERHRLEPAMPLPALAKALELPDDALLELVLAGTDLVVADGRASGAVVTPNPADAAISAVERRLRDAPFDAPDRNDLAALGLGRREVAAAERDGRLLRLDADIVLLPDAPELALAALRGLGQPFTTSQARQALHTTRRVCIPVLEYLDRAGATVRLDGQLRSVADRSATALGR